MLSIITSAVLSISAQLLCEGDLLFVCNKAGNAITQVTSGAQGLPFDHVAIVHRIGGDGGPVFVIEAVPPAVCLTPLDRFLSENAPDSLSSVVVGRVNVPFDVRGSMRRCLGLVGKPYDDLYMPGDSAIYCSELVQLNYLDASGNLIFKTVPMSFHDATGEVTDYWRDFYSGRGMAVPEGEPGSNPGELSRRPQVTIIGNY